MVLQGRVEAIEAHGCLAFRAASSRSTSATSKYRTLSIPVIVGAVVLARLVVAIHLAVAVIILAISAQFSRSRVYEIIGIITVGAAARGGGIQIAVIVVAS